MNNKSNADLTTPFHDVKSLECRWCRNLISDEKVAESIDLMIVLHLDCYDMILGMASAHYE